ncbi:MAG: sugar kinase [Rhodobacteraceae bacterium]|nr:sugar kinase [Paracoccaceae bacterium]
MTPRSQKILCIGECMVEIASGEGKNCTKGFAGDTFNTAWYLRRALPAAWDVSYFTAIGDDTASEEMRAFMQAAGVNTADIIKVPGKTVGLYMIHLQNGERSFSYWRESAAARMLANDETRLRAAMRTAGTLYFSGITVAILDPQGRRNLLAAVKNARENGATVVFDSNLRPRLWENESTMKKEIMRAAAVSDIVLPSFEDEADYFKDACLQDTVARYHAAGASLVVVKNGGGEILASKFGADTCVQLPEIIAAPVDTTAAGDAFNAGFLSAYLLDQDLAAALKAGSALSARVISQRGALVENTDRA